MVWSALAYKQRKKETASKLCRWFSFLQRVLLFTIFLTWALGKILGILCKVLCLCVYYMPCFLKMSSRGLIKYLREALYLWMFANSCSRSFLLAIHAILPICTFSKPQTQFMLYFLYYALLSLPWTALYITLKNVFSWNKTLGNKGHVCASLYEFWIFPNVIQHWILKIYGKSLSPFYGIRNGNSNIQRSELIGHRLRSAIQSSILFPHQIFITFSFWLVSVFLI